MKTLQQIWARLKNVRGNIDGFNSGSLLGWVQVRNGTIKNVSVGIFVNDTLIAQAPANIFRDDLAAAEIGSGHHAFEIPITDLILDLVVANGGHAKICTLSPRPVCFGTWTVPQEHKLTQPIEKISTSASPIQKLIYSSFHHLQDAVSNKHKAPVVIRPATPSHHAKLFETKNYINPTDGLQPPMFSYADFIRLKKNIEAQPQIQDALNSIPPFLEYYLNDYSTSRHGLRVPISADALEVLNQSDETTLPFTYALNAFLINAPKPMLEGKTTEPHYVDDILFWWAQTQVKALHCEDCLITEQMIKHLRAVPAEHLDQCWAPSCFMVKLAQQTPALAALDLQTVHDRQALGCATLLLASMRPDYLRYFPEGLIDALLTQTGGESPFLKFCREMNLKITNLKKSDYVAAFRQLGFDLDQMTFHSLTAEGHRVESAGSFHKETIHDLVDVQLIGPLQKTSGLGQAARLSAEILDHTPFKVNKVNFNLDNPSPERSIPSGLASSYCQAKINVIQLNAETIPLAFAYQSDVFTNAYNIGYLFWELDSPGTCQHLGLDLLDEVWVSSDYGVQVFQPHTSIPVTNVGMSFETIPSIEPEDARSFLEEVTEVKSDDFVFLVTFDSFSFVQRKNPVGVVSAFRTAFPDKCPEHQNVRLVIKTQNRSNITDPAQSQIWAQIDALASQDSRIVLFDETLPYKDVLKLKKGANAYLSLHRAEGWGFGIIEAMNLSVPVICTNYSGNVEFCHPGTFWPVKYDLKDIALDDYIFVRDGQKWADPDTLDAARQMAYVRSNPREAKKRAEAAFNFIQKNFDKSTISKRYSERIEAILGGGYPPNHIAPHSSK